MKTTLKNPFICFLILVWIGSSCSNYDPASYLSIEEQHNLAVKIAAYTEKKPKHISYPDRFNEENKPYYQAMTERVNYKLIRFFREDSLNYFLIVKNERTGDAKRGVGGVFTLQKDSINTLTIEFVTPVLNAEEVEYKSSELFKSMVSKTLEDYKGNMSFIEWPNRDVVYDNTSNRWVFPENSNYKIFETVMTNQR
jgi:hypothetical protein